MWQLAAISMRPCGRSPTASWSRGKWPTTCWRDTTQNTAGTVDRGGSLSGIGAFVGIGMIL